MTEPVTSSPVTTSPVTTSPAATDGHAANATGGIAGLTQDLVAVQQALVKRSEMVATAESLTGGGVAVALTDLPGSSAIMAGGIVAYHSSIKQSLVGVNADLLTRGGAVQDEVARQLAEGAARVFGCAWGIGTTGVAGPDPSDGKPVGTVFVAVHGPDGTTSRRLTVDGDRHSIRAATVASAVADLRRRLAG